VLVSPRGDPILAHWHYGLGRVVTWTSDVSGRWTGDWLAWPGASGFFARLLRWTMPEPVDPRLRISTEVVGRQVTLRADGVEDSGAFADGLDSRATLVAPDGRATEVRLPQAGPGRYEQSVAVDQPGVYRVVVRQASSGREEVGGFFVDPAEETRRLGTNASLLEWLSNQTGGRRLASPAEAFARRADSAAAHSRELPLWPWLLAAALGLWPVDVALRRLRLGIRRR
jgi:hypothetical protein